MGILFPPHIFRALDCMRHIKAETHRIPGGTHSLSNSILCPLQSRTGMERKGGQWQGAVGRWTMERNGGGMGGTPHPRYSWEDWIPIAPCPKWIGLEDSEDAFQLPQSQLWSSFSPYLIRSAHDLAIFIAQAAGLNFSLFAKFRTLLGCRRL